MAISPQSLFSHPNALAPHYSRFRVAERLLLTGHSHQAWPDRGFEGHARAWEDAAHWVDEKWERAFERASRVRDGWATLLDDGDGLYSLAASTHDLLVRLLSALPLGERPRLVTTDGEFHTLRRQLDRLREEGVEIARVPAMPAAQVGERLAAAADDRTAAVLSSTVFFANAHLAGGLDAAAEACRRHGCILILDVYHHLDALPFSLRQSGFEDAYVLGGGYKYCQLGEGNAFLRFPSESPLRPVVTGWFAEFGELAAESAPDRVAYSSGHDRFAGATYDPTSHYRAAEVFDFFDDQGLDAELLRAVSRHQVGLLARRFDELELDPEVLDRDRSVPVEELGGFLALDSPRAGEICRRLREAGVHTDFRGPVLRLGPAPYLCDRQLEAATEILGETVRSLT